MFLHWVTDRPAVGQWRHGLSLAVLYSRPCNIRSLSYEWNRASPRPLSLWPIPPPPPRMHWKGRGLRGAPRGG